MVSKPKGKLFWVNLRGRASHGGFTVLRHFVVVARNEKEACLFASSLTGKHAKLQAGKIVYPPTMNKYAYLKHGDVEEIQTHKTGRVW